MVPLIYSPNYNITAFGLEQLHPFDSRLMTMARERDIPVAMVLSGGYSAESWRIHTEGIECILTRFDRE